MSESSPTRETGAPLPAEEDRTGLVSRCIAGDEAAWARVVDSCGGAVYGALMGYLKNRGVVDAQTLADDLFSEVFASLLENDCRILRQFQGRCGLSTWLAIIARSQAARHLRRKRLRTVSLSGTLERLASSGQRDALSALERREAVEKVMASVQELPAKSRVALLMHAFGERSYADIAKVLGISENSVGPLVSRALAKLREKPA